MKRLLCFLLIFILTSAFLISCKTNNADESSAANESSEDSSVNESKPEDTDKYPEVKNLEDRTIRILARDWMSGSTSILGYNGEVIQREDFNETEASALDIAKYETRLKIEEIYNCKIIGVLDGGTPAEFNEKVRKSAQSQFDDEGYDIVFDGWGHSSPLIAEGVFMDLNTIETLNFYNSWWDQNARTDMSVMNKLFWMTGDINTYDNEGTWVMMFNKDMASVYLQDTDLYSLVDNNQWTIDKFIELCKDVTFDSNSDDKLDEFDTWGFGTETYNAFIQVIGAGGRMTAKDADDVPIFVYEEEKNINTLIKIFDFYNDLNTVMVANAGRFNNKNYTNVWEATTIKAFREGRELFFCCGLINVVGYRDLDFSFGILPIPKYDTNQDRFYHTVSMHNMSALSVPYGSIGDYNDLGLVIEALAAESQKNVTPVYYDKNLKGRDADETADERMLDIIFASRTFDIGSAFNWGGLNSQFMSLDKNIISNFEAIRGTVQTALEDTLNAIAQN